ncbi:unnamed protein product, partial [Heterosigma akashiwo]
VLFPSIAGGDNAGLCVGLLHGLFPRIHHAVLALGAVGARAAEDGPAGGGHLPAVPEPAQAAVLGRGGPAAAAAGRRP